MAQQMDPGMEFEKIVNKFYGGYPTNGTTYASLYSNEPIVRGLLFAIVTREIDYNSSFYSEQDIQAFKAYHDKVIWEKAERPDDIGIIYYLKDTLKDSSK